MSSRGWEGGLGQGAQGHRGTMRPTWPVCGTHTRPWGPPHPWGCHVKAETRKRGLVLADRHPPRPPCSRLPGPQPAATSQDLFSDL